MDPKHQFAAQYVLSRAAAERRERENLLAAVTSASGSGLLGLSGMGPGQYIIHLFSHNFWMLYITSFIFVVASGSPMCASPSAHSDSSSGNGRLSSAGSEAGGLNNNNNNCNTKLGDILRSECCHFYSYYSRIFLSVGCLNNECEKLFVLRYNQHIFLTKHHI